MILKNEKVHRTPRYYMEMLCPLPLINFFPLHSGFAIFTGLLMGSIFVFGEAINAQLLAYLKRYFVYGS